MAVTEAASKPIDLGRTRRTTVIVFFIFMLVHQVDKLVIGPLQIPIMYTFHMDYTNGG